MATGIFISLCAYKALIMSYENIWETGGVYRKYYNGINGKEIIQAIEDVLSHKLFNTINYVINDMLQVSEHEVTTSDVITVAKMDREAVLINPDIKIAIVATVPTVKVLASLYGDLMSNTPYLYKIFDNVDDARVWVGS